MLENIKADVEKYQSWFWIKADNTASLTLAMTYKNKKSRAKPLHQ
jgi:hypothetical protein